VAAKAARKASSEKLGSKPGASRATLAAGRGGTPVCIATHTTQMMSAQPVKNSRVNQSISAATLRLSVGSAKAARVASAGRPSSSARSAVDVSSAAASDTPRNHRGSATWRLLSWRRQRQTVQNASGQAGHANQTRNLATPGQSRLNMPGSIRQRHTSSVHARAAASSVAVATRLALTRRRSRASSSAERSSRPVATPPMPNSSAIHAAPLSARPINPASTETLDATLR
jgi:hypothetical protein